MSGRGDVLMLCGPGNNGGDGYVAARHLAACGYPVKVAALAEPTADAARWARSQWDGPVEPFAGATDAPIVIDCLFGTGLSRGLEQSVFQRLLQLVDRAIVAVACDLPSGVSSDDGALLSPIGQYDLTVTFGALKPAHRLMPAMASMGRVVLADIGIEAETQLGRNRCARLCRRSILQATNIVAAWFIASPARCRERLRWRRRQRPSRGQAMFVFRRRFRSTGFLSSIVQTGGADLQDERIGCILVGPGLGDVPQVLTLALTAPRPIVIDADAIGLIGEPERLHGHDTILTPHEGEFNKLFGEIDGSKPERALEAARRSQSVIVYKGPDTLVASPDGRLGFAPPAPAWLASAGTGDVLAGMIAALRARGLDPFDAACAAVWLHGRAAEAAGPGMIADDLVDAIPAALADL